MPDSYLPGVNILVFLPNVLILLLMCWKILELLHALLLYAYLVESFCSFFFSRRLFIKFSYIQNFFFVSSSHVFAVKLLNDFQVYFHQHFFTSEFQCCVGLHIIKWSSFVCTIDGFNLNLFYVLSFHSSTSHMLFLNLLTWPAH